MENNNTYCLFCRSGLEGKIIDRLKDLELQAYSPQADRVKSNKEGSFKRLARLLPGYVFLDAASEPDWNEIRKINGVLRILQYADGQYALRQSDMKFIEWLKRFNQVIEVSLALQVGTRLQFVSGPLKEMSGQIIKVNKKRRVVAVQFGDDSGLFQVVWCSFDYVQNSVDSDELKQSYS